MDHLPVEAPHDAGLPNGVARPACEVIVVLIVRHSSCRLHSQSFMNRNRDPQGTLFAFSIMDV